MKVLSVMNPWGSLIIHGRKDVENRSWHTDYRGEILIHVSQKPMSGYRENIAGLSEKGLLWDFEGNMETIKAECGHIIGSIVIEDCVTWSRSPWAEQNCYHFLLKYPRPLEKPIPAKGRLGFWEYTGELQWRRYNNSPLFHSPGRGV
jgi:hypothetical protein